MQVDRPIVRGCVHAAIKEIRDSGVEPSADDIVWLWHASESGVAAGRFDPMDDVGVRVRCGRAWLSPITLAGSLWLGECADKWWPEKEFPAMSTACRLYALANGGDEDAMRRVWQSRADARNAVVGWGVTHLPVSKKAIFRAMLALNGGCVTESWRDDVIEKSDAGGDQVYDWGDQIAALSAVYKQPGSHFLFRVPAKAIRRMVRYAAYAIGKPELAAEDSGRDDGYAMFRGVVREIIRRGNNGAQN